MYIYTIYKTTNLINNRYYIGKHKTTDPYDSYLGSGKILKQAISAYGSKNFIKEIIEVCDSEEHASIREREIVNEAVVADPNSYNICLGGTGGNIHTEETLRRMSANLKGNIPWNKGKKIWSEAQRKEIGERNAARGPQSPETIKKRTDKTTGKTRTQEQKDKTSNTLKGRVFSEETKQRMSLAKKNTTWSKSRRDSCNPDKGYKGDQWRIVDTATNMVIIVHSLKKWCAANNLSYSMAHRFSQENRDYKGYSISKHITSLPTCRPRF